MLHFTTDFQIIPATAILTPRVAVQPLREPDILSILPGNFSISADTAALIVSHASEQIPLRRAA